MAQCSHATTGAHPAAARRTISRRSFFGRVGAATAGVALAGCDIPGGTGGEPPAVDPTTAPAPPPVVPIGGAPNTFGRLFPDLPPFAEDSRALQEALVEIGSSGGIMDANDDLAAGPVELITDLSLSENNQNNANHSAGITFIGQFIDHDLTRDLNSPLGVPADPGDHRNGRNPAFDLDSLYSRGPRRDRQFYDPEDPIKLPITP